MGCRHTVGIHSYILLLTTKHPQGGSLLIFLPCYTLLQGTCDFSVALTEGQEHRKRQAMLVAQEILLTPIKSGPSDLGSQRVTAFMTF